MPTGRPSADAGWKISSKVNLKRCQPEFQPGNLAGRMEPGRKREAPLHCRCSRRRCVCRPACPLPCGKKGPELAGPQDHGGNHDNDPHRLHFTRAAAKPKRPGYSQTADFYAVTPPRISSASAIASGSDSRK